MLRRFLNIASIVCLVWCAAFFALWLASNFVHYEVDGHLPFRQVFSINSLPGRLYIDWDTLDDLKIEDRTPSEVCPWTYKLGSVDDFSLGSTDDPGPLVKAGFSFGYLQYYGWILLLPFWFLVLTSASLAMIFRLRWPWQFNLRSLFVATTFLAVVLGMIAWLDRTWIGK